MLVTLLWQKRLFVTTVPLIFLTSNIILTIVVQIITWMILDFKLEVEYGAMPLRIVYVLDYVFSYGASAAFYYYIEALAIDEYNRIGVVYTPRKHVKNIIIDWGLVTAAIYSVSLFIPSLYHLEGTVGIFSIPAYVVIHIIFLDYN